MVQSKMAEESHSLKSLFEEAERLRSTLDTFSNPNSSSFQEILAKSIERYERCNLAANHVSLFSLNESVEDVATGDLPYFLVHYQLAELLPRSNGDDRRGTLVLARQEMDKFLKLLDSYDMLSGEEMKLLARYRDSPDTFSTASLMDAVARRQTKISRFKEERAMMAKLTHLRENPKILETDDAVAREVHMTHIALSVHQAFQALESIALEIQILSFHPPTDGSAPTDRQAPDDRSRHGRREDGYSDRLDGPLSQLSRGRGGPILSKDGRPLQPFTLLDSRQRLRDGVFRPDHSLPTMTIDEYLEEEKRRGGMIEGGGAQSGIRPAPDEDDYERADEETMKARAWDEYKEENPRGAGNTMNMG